MSRINALKTANRITADHVLGLRRDLFTDGVVSDDEIRDLLALARAVPAGDIAWAQFFAEAVADYAAHQQSPAGYVPDPVAALLIKQMGPAHQVSALCFDALIHLFCQSKQVPAKLAAYALAAAKAVILRDGVITGRDVIALRNLFYAAGGDGHVAITQAEANLAFDLNDAVQGANNDTAWPALFQQIISAFLLAHLGAAPLPRAEALRLENWIENGRGIEWRAPQAPGPLGKGVRAALGQMFGGPSETEKLYAALNTARTQDASQAQQITPEETEWLIDRIGRDGIFDAAETALVNHLRALSAEMNETFPPALRKLIAA